MSSKAVKAVKAVKSVRPARLRASVFLSALELVTESRDSYRMHEHPAAGECGVRCEAARDDRLA